MLRTFLSLKRIAGRSNYQGTLTSGPIRMRSLGTRPKCSIDSTSDTQPTCKGQMRSQPLSGWRHCRSSYRFETTREMTSKIVSFREQLVAKKNLGDVARILDCFSVFWNRRAESAEAQFASHGCLDSRSASLIVVARGEALVERHHAR
jgi:hypothetical protein